jgi:homoserine kinase type II|tara:strand:- start:655 stop:1593 length:939 start_codon:yes stop_codon:yes gene_type:complete
MAVYTNITLNDLIDWNKEFNLPEIVDFNGISSGVTNSNYLIYMPDSKYILTIFEHNTVEELPFYVNLMTYLTRKSFLCPTPIENKKGHSLALLKDKPALMVSFLKGKEKKVGDSKSCFLVGKYLAKLHLITKNFSQSNKNTRDLNWMTNKYLDIKKYLSNEEKKIIESEINYHKGIDKVELPEGIIHGDLFKDNVLFLNDNISGFIDFYYACNENFIYDIAIAVNDWCIDNDGKINTLKCTEFTKGYQSERKFTDNEYKYFNSALRLSALRFWLSRLEDSYDAKEGELTNIKDPNHFKNILLDRQTMKNYVD